LKSVSLARATFRVTIFSSPDYHRRLCVAALLQRISIAMKASQPVMLISIGIIEGKYAFLVHCEFVG